MAPAVELLLLYSKMATDRLTDTDAIAMHIYVRFARVNRTETTKTTTLQFDCRRRRMRRTEMTSLDSKDVRK